MFLRISALSISGGIGQPEPPPPTPRPGQVTEWPTPSLQSAAPVMQLSQQRRCADGRAAGGSPLRCVCGVLHGFSKAAWKPYWLFLLSLLTWKAILFTPFFFFFGNDMNPSKVSSRVLWKRVKAKLDYQNKKAGGHDWSFWNRLLLQTWKKTFTHNEK